MTALGVVLVMLGAIVIVLEAHVPSLGMLGGPGVVALGVGTLLAISGLGGGLGLALIAAVLLAAASGAVLALSVRKGMAARRRRISAGPESLLGHVGAVHSWAASSGKVLVDGALWQAKHSWGDEDPHEFKTGDPIVVERLTGLTLAVRRAEEWEL